MARPRSTEVITAQHAAMIQTSDFSLDSAALNLDDSQRITISDAEKRIASAAIHIENLNKEIRIVKKRINESDDMQLLKELKRQCKMMQVVHRESTAKLQGMYEMVYSGIPGNTLQEKLRRIKHAANAQSPAKILVPRSA